MLDLFVYLHLSLFLKLVSLHEFFFFLLTIYLQVLLVLLTYSHVHLRKHHRALREYSPKPWGFACYLSEVTVQTMVYVRGKFIEFVSSPLIMSCFIYYFTSCPSYIMSFPGGSVVKNLPANAGDAGSIPQSGRSPGGGNGNTLQRDP